MQGYATGAPSLQAGPVPSENGDRVLARLHLAGRASSLKQALHLGTKAKPTCGGTLRCRVRGRRGSVSPARLAGARTLALRALSRCRAFGCSRQAQVSGAVYLTPFGHRRGSHLKPDPVSVPKPATVLLGDPAPALLDCGRRSALTMWDREVSWIVAGSSRFPLPPLARCNSASYAEEGSRGMGPSFRMAAWRRHGLPNDVCG